MSKTLLLIVTIIAFALPLVIAIIFKIKTKCVIRPFIVGMLCFMVFANLLESIVHTYFLSMNNTTAAFIQRSPIIYGLYGGLMAGLFEETGRLFGFKVLLKNNKEKETAVAYGIGHGGIECILVLGSTYLIYYLAMSGFNLGDTQINNMLIETAKSINPSLAPIAIFERVSAMILHIGLSILVFTSVNKNKKFYLYPVAILIHMISDIPAGLYQIGMISSIMLIELLTLVIAIVTLLISLKMYKKLEKGE